jgi:preprotein translocase subunit SecF
MLHVEVADGKDLPTDKVEAMLKDLKLADGKSIGTAYVQRKSTATGGDVIAIRGEQEAGAIIEGAVNKNFKDSVKGTSLETVGALIGSEAAKTSLIALGVALIFIFLYLLMRYEFAFALGAVIALVDVALQALLVRLPAMLQGR